MKAILSVSEAQKIGPWIVGVLIVFLGMFLVGLAVDHRNWLGYCVAACVLLSGILIVWRWFLRSR
jgi:hypothetical protein